MKGEFDVMNKEKIEEYVKQILIELGADINSEGIQETPKRVANMYEEVFCGMNYTNHDIATMFDKTFEEEYDVMHTNTL